MKLPWIIRLVVVLNEKAQRAVFRTFERIGKKIAQSPSLAIGIALIFALLSSVYIFAATKGSDSIFWVPTDSEYYSQRNYYQLYYGQLQRLNVAFLTSKTKGGDLMNSQSLTDWYYVHETIRNLAALKNTSIKFPNVCYRGVTNKSPCVLITAMDYFLSNNTFGKWDIDDIQSQTKESIEERFSVGMSRSPRGNLLFRPGLFGSVTYNGSVPTKIEAFRAMWATNGDPDYVENSEMWEDAFLDSMKNMSQNLTHTNLYYSSAQSLSQETSSYATEDLPVILASFLILVVGLMITIGRLNCYQTRFWVALGGYLTISIAVLSGLGWATLFNQPINTYTVIMIPYFIFSLGTNTISVMLGDFDSYRSRNGINSSTSRLKKTIKNVGVTIFLVAFVYCFAFLIATSTSIPVAKQFSYQVIFCVIMLWVYLMTMFSGIMVFDAKRVEQRRTELCIKSECFIGVKDSEGMLRKFCRKFYLPGLRKIYVKIPVAIFFALFFGAGLYGTTQLTMGLDSDQFVPSGYYREYLDISSEHFSHLGRTVWFVLGNYKNIDQRINYTDHDVQDQLLEIYDKLNNNKYMLHYGSYFWFSDFMEWVQRNDSFMLENGRIPSNDFYPWLSMYLNTTAGTYYRSDLIFENETGNILISRFFAYYIKLNSTMDYMNAMIDIEKTLAPYQMDIPMFAYAGFETFYGQFIGYARTVFGDLAIIIGAIFILCVIIFKSIIASLLNVAFVSAVVIITMGFSTFAGIQINAITLMTVIFSAVFALESCAHFTLKFLTYHGSRTERAERAFLDVSTLFGSNVFTTLLGHLVILVFSKYYFFRDYFGTVYVIFCTAIYLHLMILMPIAFSTFGPPSYYSKKRETHEIDKPGEMELPELDDSELREFITDETRPADKNELTNEDKVVEA